MFSRTGSTALEERLSSLMSEARFLHSKATAATSLSLVRQYQETIDLELCRKAALLHDIAREWKAKDLLSYAEEHHLALQKEEEGNPVLLHAPVGADLLLHKGYDSSLCLAVRYHTLGSVQMGRLGLVLFIADYIEPRRGHLTDETRKELLGLTSLELICLEILGLQEPYLERKKQEPAQCSLELRRYLQAGGRL